MEKVSVRVLVVDDSAFMRRRVAEILEEDPGIVVADVAGDGMEAVRKAVRVRPDVILMDVEMPVMDGIEAVRRIMRRHPTPILMFSSLTRSGAQATLDALEAGALDFLPKQIEDIHRDRRTAGLILRRRVRTLAAQRLRMGVPQETAGPSAATRRRTTERPVHGVGRPGLLVIASSTGGPVALQKILPKLPSPLPFPILLIQHMPGTFTPGFAERLNHSARIEVREAIDGDRLRPGLALLAPGGRQLELISGNRIRLRDPREGEIYSPSADVAFASVAENFRGRVLGLVLTGMGADGCRGAECLKSGGARIWAQDQTSCVVYGMPRAVVEAGLADQVLSLEEIGERFEAA